MSLPRWLFLGLSLFLNRSGLPAGTGVCNDGSNPVGTAEASCNYKLTSAAGLKFLKEVGGISGNTYCYFGCSCTANSKPAASPNCKEGTPESIVVAGKNLSCPSPTTYSAQTYVTIPDKFSCSDFQNYISKANLSTILGVCRTGAGASFTFQVGKRSYTAIVRDPTLKASCLGSSVLSSQGTWMCCGGDDEVSNQTDDATASVVEPQSDLH